MYKSYQNPRKTRYIAYFSNLKIQCFKGGFCMKKMVYLWKKYYGISFVRKYFTLEFVHTAQIICILFFQRREYMRTKKQIRQEMKLQNIKQKQKRIKRELKNEKNKTHKSSIFSFLDILRKKPVPTTAQQTIPYQELFSDGICKLENGRYSKTIQFYDINYQLAQNEDKTLIFENYCDFLNYFDSSIQFQLSFLNQSIDISEYQKSIEIPEQQDDFNGIRKEYVAMLKNQLSKGNNDLIKTKYITFSIEAETLKVAKPRLERIEADILSNFKVLGVKAQPLNGKERLHVLHSLFHSQDEQKFIFSWKDIVETGMTTKDFIAPDSFNFQYKNKFQIGKTYGAVSFLHITASELTDRMLADFLDFRQ